MLCKAKTQYLLTLQLIRYSFLALQTAIDGDWLVRRCHDRRSVTFTYNISLSLLNSVICQRMPFSIHAIAQGNSSNSILCEISSCTTILDINLIAKLCSWNLYPLRGCTSLTRSTLSTVRSLREREVACSASDRQGSSFECCVWRAVSSHSSHHPQEVLLAQFSLYVHNSGLKPDSFYFWRDPQL